MNTAIETYCGPGKLPMMGWSSQYYGKAIDETFIRSQAKALIYSNMAEAGYNYVIIHAGWSDGVDAQGIIVSDTSKFPDLGKLVKDLNNLGLKLGLYVTMGTQNGGIGGEQLLENCRRIINEWGIDLISVGEITNEASARLMHAAIRQVSEQILIDVRSNGFPGAWIAEVANQWNLFDLLEPEFYDLSRTKLDSTTGNSSADAFAADSVTHERAKYAGPGHYYNVGILPIGTGLHGYQDQAVFSAYCVLGCPLIVGIDLTKMTNETKEILTNREVLAINQDKLGKPGICSHYYDPWHSLYKKELADGETAFLIFNRCHGDAPTTLEHDRDLNIAADDQFEVHDAWTHVKIGTFQGSISVHVQTSDVPTIPCCRLYKVKVLG